MFNIEVSQDDIDKGTDKHEISLCNLWLDSAFLRATRELKFSFLTEPIKVKEVSFISLANEMDSTDGTIDQMGSDAHSHPFFYGYQNAFEIEDDIIEITNIFYHNDRQPVLYRVHGNIIYTDYPSIDVYGIKKKDITEYNNTPLEFEDLVAYALAMLIAPSIAPKDMSIQQLIMTQYQWASDRLLKFESQSNIKRTYHEELE